VKNLLGVSTIQTMNDSSPWWKPPWKNRQNALWCHKLQWRHTCFKLIREREKYAFYWFIDFEKFFSLIYQVAKLLNAPCCIFSINFYGRSVVNLWHVVSAVTEGCWPRQKVELCALLMNAVYRCSCTDDYRGLNCSEPNFCSVYSCPPPALCRNLEFGYECEC